MGLFRREKEPELTPDLLAEKLNIPSSVLDLAVQLNEEINYLMEGHGQPDQAIDRAVAKLGNRAIIFAVAEAVAEEAKVEQRTDLFRSGDLEVIEQSARKEIQNHVFEIRAEIIAEETPAIRAQAEVEVRQKLRTEEERRVREETESRIRRLVGREDRLYATQETSLLTSVLSLFSLEDEDKIKLIFASKNEDPSYNNSGRELRAVVNKQSESDNDTIIAITYDDWQGDYQRAGQAFSKGTRFRLGGSGKNEKGVIIFPDELHQRKYVALMRTAKGQWSPYPLQQIVVNDQKMFPDIMPE